MKKKVGIYFDLRLDPDPETDLVFSDTDPRIRIQIKMLRIHITARKFIKLIKIKSNKYLCVKGVECKGISERYAPKKQGSNPRNSIKADHISKAHLK